MHVCMLSHFSHVQFFVTPCTAAQQAPLSMGFFRQEYQSGLPFPFPGGLPNPGIKPVSPASACGVFTTEPPEKPSCSMTTKYRGRSKTITSNDPKGMQ